jgi:hypothetical protein
MMCVEQLVEWELAGETEVLGENLPSATLSTINPLTWPGLELGRRRGKAVTNRLSYGAAWQNVDHKICVLIWKWLQTDSFKLSIVGEVYFYRKNVAHTHIFLNRIYM